MDVHWKYIDIRNIVIVIFCGVMYKKLVNSLHPIFIPIVFRIQKSKLNLIIKKKS